MFICVYFVEGGNNLRNMIDVINLTKDYGFGRGVFDISFSIAKGEAFGLLGPNGAGKSTTIRHLMGFSSPQSGKTKILGKDSFTHYDKILKDVGYIPGELALPQGLTGFETIKMFQDLRGIYNNKRVEYLCDLFKLSNSTLKMNTKTLPLGGKRKLAIITAFMSEPDILILDEPTSGLDPFMRDVFIDFLVEEKAKGKTILLSSHLFDEVEQTCDRISIIKDGKIVSTFKTTDLKHDKNKVYIIGFKNNTSLAKFTKDSNDKDFFEIIDVHNNKVLIKTHDNYINELVKFLASFELTDFINQKETLSEYFLSFYKEDKEFEGIK